MHQDAEPTRRWSLAGAGGQGAEREIGDKKPKILRKSLVESP